MLDQPEGGWFVLNSWIKTMRRSYLYLGMFLAVCTGLLLTSNLLLAAPKKKASRSNAKETITYIVKKGDNVGKIAKQYDVRPDDVARWNNLSDVSRIKIGQKLRIRVPKGSVVVNSGKNAKAPVITQNVSYVVKKGDNLGKIARKTGVSIDDLKKNNPSLRKNPDRLRVGQTLVLRVQRFDGASGVSRGLANNGSLAGGIQLSHGPGHIVRNPSRSYGTALSVGLILDAMEAYHRKYPKSARFGIGDLSVKNGGKLTPHLSHQSGRDVDISYIHESNKETPHFVKMNASNIDIAKNWYVIEYFLKSGKIQYIFVDYELQKLFYDYAKAHGYTDKQLESMIQYPNGKKSYKAVVRHAKGHADHFHVRFVCAKTDIHCR